ncbi:MAG: MerR family transcriptional regulator [Paucibacter sp.]|nr:MerR family transcriptional regulator [Roseateles sp.]
MERTAIAIPLWLSDADTDGWLDRTELARACQVGPEFIDALISEGLLEPALAEPDWRFGSAEIARVQRITRLRRDFEASMPSLALMLDLLDEIDQLRAQLRRVHVCQESPAAP